MTTKATEKKERMVVAHLDYEPAYNPRGKGWVVTQCSASVEFHSIYNWSVRCLGLVKESDLD